MAAADRPFASVVIPFPAPVACRHPLYRCSPELDAEGRRILACSCGVDRAVSTDFERFFWFRRRVDMLALAIKRDLGGAEIDRIAEGI